MACLPEHSGHVLDRAHRLTYVWGQGRGIAERSVDIQRRRLRAQLEPLDGSDLLPTVWGCGYEAGPCARRGFGSDSVQ